MKTWLGARRLMAAMDVVMREWARMLNLGERDVFVLMIMGERGSGCCCTEIAYSMGRTRQQVQRNLLDLEVRNIVEPSVILANGKVHRWSLSPWGQRVVEVLDRLVELWEIHLEAVCDLDLLQHALDVGCSALVNCTRDSRGWSHGLADPRRDAKSDIKILEALEALEKLRAELGSQPPNEAAKRRAVERERAALERKEQAIAAADEAFARLWRD